MPAPSKTWVTIADSQVDADSPIDTVLMTGLRDDVVHLREWLGKDFTAMQNHDHDNINSKKIGGDVRYDGAYLTTRVYAAGSDQQLLASNAEKGIAGLQAGAWSKAKEFQTAKITSNSTFRIYFELRSGNGINSVSARIYRNGVAVGTTRSTSSGAYVGFSEDISGWNGTDLIQLWISTAQDNIVPYVQAFRVLVAEDMTMYHRVLLD